MKYKLYESIGGRYRYPVIVREDAAVIRPLVRLIPVRGQRVEALALLKRITEIRLEAEKEEVFDAKH